MTTEREILEYATKAMGYKVVPECEANTWIVVTENDGPSFYFSPMRNSNDCAAMCAKLMIETVWFPCHMACEIITEEDNHIWHVANYIDHNNDREAAWRYAATTVAAKIGGMK